MTTKLLTFKKFHSLDQASELIDILNQNNIVYEIEDNTNNLSDFIAGQSSDSNIIISRASNSPLALCLL